MKKKTLKKVVALLLAAVCCFALAMPSFAVSNVAAPLTSISLNDGMDAKYTLSPAFQQNTQVYAVTTTDGDMPTSSADALAIIGYTTPEGTTALTAFDVASQLLTITTTNGDDDTSIYYVSFSDKSAQKGTTNIANVEVTKILQADSDAKLDSLSFTYELMPVKIVDNSAPVGTTEIPLAADSNTGTEATGTVIITTAENKSTMVIDNWDGENVGHVEDNDELVAAQPALAGNEYITGKYEITFDSVGQYVYLLHEVTGTDSGVTYDDNWYEITISAVHLDANDPTSDVVIGWIEVKTVDNYVSNENYTPGTKVNFGTTDTIDNEKYDNLTTSITYPFINVLATEDLVISKTVTGDLGNAEQEFLFKITVNGINLADAYQITYTDNTTEAQLLPETITTDKSTGEAYVTLKHNQTLTIAELPVGATYSIEEIDVDDEHLATAAEAENYNTTVTYDDTISEDNAVVKNVVVGKKLTDHNIIDTKDVNDKNYVSYVNDKPLTPPTGVFADMVPYIAIVVVAIAGVAVFAIVRKRRNAYDF